MGNVLINWNRPQIVSVQYLATCFDSHTKYAKYLSIFPYFLFIIPFLPFVGITENVYAYEQGKFYYLIPFLIGWMAEFTGRVIGIERSWLECLTYMHSNWAYPCYEIAVASSYCWVEILYYWPHFLQDDGSYVQNVWYIARRILILSMIPVLSYYTYTATLWQSLISIVFSTISIPIFLVVMNILNSTRYFEWRSQFIQRITEWWNPPPSHDD